MSAGVRRVLALEWPSRFPIVQFPNPPLLAAFAASGVARFTDGTTHDAAFAAATVGYGVWAGLELFQGDNWFRRLLGAGGLVWVVSRIVSG